MNQHDKIMTKNLTQSSTLFSQVHDCLLYLRNILLSRCIVVKRYFWEVAKRISGGGSYPPPLHPVTSQKGSSQDGVSPTNTATPRKQLCGLHISIGEYVLLVRFSSANLLGEINNSPDRFRTTLIVIHTERSARHFSRYESQSKSISLDNLSFSGNIPVWDWSQSNKRATNVAAASTSGRRDSALKASLAFVPNANRRTGTNLERTSGEQSSRLSSITPVSVCLFHLLIIESKYLSIHQKHLQEYAMVKKCQEKRVIGLAA